MKDYLRCCLVVTTLPEVCRVWDAVEALKAQGRLEVLSIKNRFRCVDGAPDLVYPSPPSTLNVERSNLHISIQR